MYPRCGRPATLPAPFAAAPGHDRFSQSEASEIFHEVGNSMSRAYLPVLMLLGFVVTTAILIVAFSALTTRSRPTPVKQNPYESGMPTLGDARERFSVKFYLIAILF